MKTQSQERTGPTHRLDAPARRKRGRKPRGTPWVPLQVRVDPATKRWLVRRAGGPAKVGRWLDAQRRTDPSEV